VSPTARTLKVLRERGAYDPVKRRVATLRRFGLGVPDYARILLSQDGVCAICRRPPTNYALHVDHDHRTNEIRGLLCHRCNRGLGYFAADCAAAIAAYLTKTGTGWFVPKKRRKR
jgi:hypothetical protein